jgi:hypothetical protein
MVRMTRGTGICMITYLTSQVHCQSHVYHKYIHILHIPLYTPLPLCHLPNLRPRRPHNLIAIQQTQRIKRLLQLPHRIHCTFAKFMLEIIPLHESNAVFTRRCAFELNGALDHVVHKVLGLFVVGFAVVENNR